MVEQVGCLSDKLQAHALGNVESFHHRDIDVLDRRQPVSVPRRVRIHAAAGGNIPGVRVIRQITNCRTSRVGQGRNATAYTLGSRRVYDYPISGRIAVQIRVDNALQRGPATGLIRVNGRKLPVADQVLHKPVLASLEEWHVVEHRYRRPVTMIERRIGALGPQILEILRTARGGHGAEYFGGRIVNVMAPGIGNVKLQTVAETTRKRGR